MAPGFAAMASAPPKLLSLVFLIDHTKQEVLLGLKKRGFGAGKWNGFGGKLEAGETMQQCAARELREESGIQVPADALTARGRMCFDMLNDSGMKDKASGLIASRLLVHIFTANVADATGEPFESEEMKPKWFSYPDEINFDHMWLDDQYWLPALLDGNDVTG